MNFISIFPNPSKLIDIENTNKIVLFIYLKITDDSIKEKLKNDFLKAIDDFVDKTRAALDPDDDFYIEWHIQEDYQFISVNVIDRVLH